MDNFSYFIRTIGDGHPYFLDAVERAVSRSDFQEVMVSSKSKSVFAVFAMRLSVSIIYTGKYERYFEYDQFSSLDIKSGRRFLRDDLLFIRESIRGLENDEAWVNLKQAEIKFAVIHKTKNVFGTDLSKILKVKSLLSKSNMPVYEFFLNTDYISVGTEIKKDIDRIYVEQAYTLAAS